MKLALPVSASTTSLSLFRSCVISCVVQKVSLPNANGTMFFARSVLQYEMIWLHLVAG